MSSLTCLSRQGLTYSVKQCGSDAKFGLSKRSRGRRAKHFCRTRFVGLSISHEEMLAPLIISTADSSSAMMALVE